MAKEIVEIPTERLLPNPYQPRKQFSSEEMLGLADSIQQNGVLQPLLARRINNSDYYELIAGERRLTCKRCPALCWTVIIRTAQ